LPAASADFSDIDPSACGRTETRVEQSGIDHCALRIASTPLRSSSSRWRFNPIGTCS